MSTERQDQIDFERQDDPREEFKIWEAGLATSAAPFYFRAFNKPENKTDYVDGGLHNNCPARYAVDEIRRIWPNSGHSKMDLLVSVGTSIQKKHVKVPKALEIESFQDICAAFF